MTINNANINTGKFKYLSSKQIDYVVSAMIAFESVHKGIKRNISKN